MDFKLSRCLKTEIKIEIIRVGSIYNFFFFLHFFRNERLLLILLLLSWQLLCFTGVMFAVLFLFFLRIWTWWLLENLMMVMACECKSDGNCVGSYVYFDELEISFLSFRKLRTHMLTCDVMFA
jgi:hypothetical protein